MSTRLLHVADLHLDRAFAAMGCNGELAIRRRLGLREALRRAGAHAMETRCCAVTIGGDLYEHDRAGADTAAFLADTFASWQPMRVLVAPGNHDALLPVSLDARTQWPSNVHLFTSERLAPVELEDGLTVWGLAHLEPSWQGDPLEHARAGGDGGVHLALFHGAELGSRPDGKSIHGPFHAADIRRRGFAAALCGHYHRRRVDADLGLLYPGSPEPLSLDEVEDRGAVMVEVAGDGTVSYHKWDDSRWHARVVRADVSSASSLSAVLDAAWSSVSQAVAGVDPDRTMVRVDLGGDVDHALPIDVPTVETAVRDGCGVAAVQVRDLTSRSVSVAAVEGEKTVRGAFARAVAAAAGGCGETDGQVLDDALRYGLQALAGVPIGLR